MTRKIKLSKKNYKRNKMKQKNKQKLSLFLGLGIFFSLLLSNSGLIQTKQDNNYRDKNLKTAAASPDPTDGGDIYSDFGPTTVIAGISSFSVWCNVTNGPINGPTGDFKVAFVASLDIVINITTGDFLLGKVDVSSLGTGESVIVSWSGIFPGSIPAGNYTIGWIIDVDNEVDEGSSTGYEDNNIHYEPLKSLIVQPTSPPDFSIFIIIGTVSAIVIIPAGIAIIYKRRT